MDIKNTVIRLDSGARFCEKAGLQRGFCRNISNGRHLFMKRTHAFLGGIVAFLFLFSPLLLNAANPVGEQVVSGSVSFDRTVPGVLSIGQGSDSAIINWDDFSIGAGNLTRFNQPGASSAALNRVVGGNPSSIYGQLQANGQIFLINPAGVLVGASGQIDTAGLVASTLDLSNESFLSNSRLTLSGDSDAAVQNLGQISASGGNVYLIARTVENAGSISASVGTVGLGGGSEVVVTDGGGIAVLVGSGSVGNSGSIAAASAELKAVGGNIYALAINNSGVVRASSLVNEGGRIVLRAEGATAVNSGSLVADGGEVQLLGGQVGLDGSIDVGTGGTALVGGGFQGSAPGILNSQRTVVGPDATINADGGTVVVWADGLTSYNGNISAQGGNVEVSGKQSLALTGGIDAGSGGTILLDPQDLTIVATGANDSLVTSSGLAAGSPDATTDVTIGSSAIEALTGAITLEASRNLSINDGLNLSNQTSGEAVAFTAGGDLTIGAAVSTGGGAMTFTASSGGVNSGSATLTIQGPTTGGNVTFVNDGTKGILLGSSIPNTGKNVVFSDDVDVTADVTVTGADITFSDKLDADSTSNNRNLTLTSTGTATLASTVGSSGQFSALTVDGGGLAALTGGTIKSTTLTLENDIEIDKNTTITATTAQFDGAVDVKTGSSRTLTVNASGNTIFGGKIGTSGGTLTALTTDATGATTLKGGTVTATTIKFSDAVTIGADTTIGNAAVTFGSTLDADLAANNRALTISSTTGNQTFSGSVGGTQRLGSITTTSGGKATFKGSAVGATTQTYGGDVLIGANNTFTGTTVTFAKLNGSGGGKTLTINASGTTTFGGLVGTSTKLGALTTDSAGTSAINTTAVRADTMTFNDPLTLGADPTITGTTVNFANTVDGDIPDDRDLTVTATTTSIQAGGKIGTTGLLKSLTTDNKGTTIIAVTGGTVKATTQTYKDPLDLDVNTTLQGSTITLEKGVANSTTLNLTINANLVTTIGGTVGADTSGTNFGPLGTLETDAAGSTTLSGTAINAVTQNYKDAITLSGNLTLDSTGTITFSKTLDSSTANSKNLTLNTGTTVFTGAIGSTKAIGLLDVAATTTATTISGGAVKAKTQTYNELTTLTADTTLTGTTITLNDVDFAPSADDTYSLTINAGGVTTISGVLGTAASTFDFKNLTTDASGTLKIGANIQTDGTQTYNEKITLTGNAQFDGTAITFNKAIDSDATARTLVVNASGVTTFADKVGNSKALSSLTTDAGGGTTIGGSAVKANTQTYGDDVTVSPATLTFTATDGAGTGAITFSGKLDGSAADTKSVIVNSDGVTTFAGAVGGVNQLKALTTDDASGQSDTTVLNGTTVKAITQTYNDPVTIGVANATLTGTTLTFVETVDAVAAGGFSLTANVSGVTTFTKDVGEIGVTTFLGGLTTDLTGSTVIKGTKVNATTIDFNDPVTINAAASSTVVMRGKNDGTAATSVTFAGTVNANKTTDLLLLDLDTTTATLGGIVGGTGVFADLNASAATKINTSAVNATVQTYTGATTIGATTTLTGTTVTLTGAVDADAAGNSRALNVNASGVTTFTGAVGATQSLGLLTTDSAGSSVITANITSTTQTYNDGVTLAGAATLAGTDITLNSTLAGATFALIANGSGTTAFNGAVTGVGALTTDSAGKTKIGADITTTGIQTFADSVIIAANLTLDAGTAALNLNGTVNADLALNNRALTLTTTGAITLAKNVGDTDPLGTLTQTDGASGVAIDGASVDIGTQTYNDAVTISSTTGTTFKATDITFAATATIAGSAADKNLTISATGTTTITAGMGANIGTLLVDNGGTTVLGAGITTVSNQTYNDPVTLAANVAANVGTGDTVTFGSTVDGAFTLATDGKAVFSGVVGGTALPVSVTVTEASTLGANISTSGAQTYTGLATLADDVTLTVGGALDATGGISGSASNFNLVLATATPKVGATAGTVLGGNLASVGDLQFTGAALLSGSLTTSGKQTYDGAVTLAAATTLTGTDITLNSTVGSANALTLTGAGVTTIGGAITTITGLTINGGGLTSIGAAVTVAGDMIIDDTIVLAANTTLTTTGAANSIALKGIAGNGKTLTLVSGDTTASSMTLAGSIGGVSTFQATTGGTGTIIISGGKITTTGTQTYDDPVSLTAATTLTGTTITTSVAGALIDGAQALTIVGDAVFAGPIGSGTPLGALSVSGTTTLPASVATGATAQTYTGAVTLAGATALTGSNITFGSTVNTAGALTITGAATINGIIGGVTPITSIAVSGTTSLGANVTTSGIQTYTGLATQTADSTLTGTVLTITAGIAGGGFDTILDFSTAPVLALGNITGVKNFTLEKLATISGTLTTTGTQTYKGVLTLGSATTLVGTTITTEAGGSMTGAAALTITGDAVFGAAIGTTADLTSLSVSGTTSHSGTVETSAAQTYTGNVTLTAATTLVGTTVTTSGTVDGGFALVVTGNGVFSGALGGTTALTSTSVSGTTSLGANVTTTAAQTYTGAVTQTANSVLKGTVLTVTASLAGGGFDTTLDFSTPHVMTLGNFTGIKDFVAADAITLNGGTLTTTGTQTYKAAVTLANAASTLVGTTITTESAATIDGTFALTVTGDAVFGAAIGGGTTIAALSVSGTTSLPATVITTGVAQTYTGAVTLTADTALTSSLVTASSTIDATTANAQGLTVTGAAAFVGNVGGTTALKNLSVSTTTTLTGNVTTDTAATGTQVYTGDLTLAGNSVLTGGGITLGGGAGAVTGANFNLTLDISNDPTLSLGEITGVTDLIVQKAATVSGTQTSVGAGTQTYNGPLTLATAGTTLVGATVTTGASATIDGAQALIVTGNAVFGAAIGATTPVTSTAVSGTSSLAADVTTTTTQVYTGDATLTTDATLKGTVLTLTGNLIGGSKNLTIDMSGAQTLDLAKLTAVKNLTLSKSATVGGSVSTSGTQTYSAALTLNAATTLTSTGTGTSGDITLDGTVDAAFALNVDTAGTSTFNKAVGGTTPVTSVTTDSGGTGVGSTKIGASIETAAGQVYNDSVTLTSSVVLTGTTLTLNAVNGGSNNLTLSGTGLTTLLGTMSDLTTLTVDNGSTTTFGVSGGTGSISVTTATFQTYNDAILVEEDTTLTGSPVTLLGGSTVTAGKTLTTP